MSDPREPEDANSPWARPGQPIPTPEDSSSSDEPRQQARQPDPSQHPYQAQQWPEQQNWPPQQQGQPPLQGWPDPSYPHGEPYQQGQPYPQQWAQDPRAGANPAQSGNQYYPGQAYGAEPAQKYGEFPSTSTDTPKRSRVPLYVALVVLVVLIGSAAAYFLTGRSTLGQQAAEIGVAQVLATSYGLENVTDVSCPSGQRVKENDTFICTVLIDGESRDVTITFVDDDGTYEVGRPM